MSDTDSEGGAAETAAAPKGKLKLIIAAVGLFVIVGGGAATWFMFFRGHSEEVHAEAAAAPKPAVYIDVPEMLVNLVGAPGERVQYLKAKIVLEVKEEKLIEAIKPTAIIGVSTDSFYSHKNWFADRKTFPQDVTHPVIADTNHAVSRAFGVLKEDQGVAFRATVVVDDKGIVRSVAVNDLSVGRSPKEVLRTVQALKSGGLCGADWKKGESFVG